MDTWPEQPEERNIVAMAFCAHTMGTWGALKTKALRGCGVKRPLGGNAGFNTEVDPLSRVTLAF